MLYDDDSKRPITYDNSTRIGDEPVDIFQPEGLDYPIIEKTYNALLFPWGHPVGRIDLQDTYEISSVPEDPGTPLESVGFLEEKGVIPD